MIKHTLPAIFSVLAAVAAIAAEPPLTELHLDWAYYNPLSLVLKHHGWLESEFQPDGITVQWTQSLGSNKALELLRSKSIDIGSTAGAAAFIGRANGNPIKAIYVYSKPEWAALVTRPGTGIKTPADLKGRKVAVTRGTDPHIFLLRALAAAGLREQDIELVPLQHADGRTALEKGDVDAWAGLDPYMAQVEVNKHYPLFFRKADFNSYGVLDTREDFARAHPLVLKRVLAAYERARRWAIEHPDDVRKILAEEAKLDDAVAAKVLERTDLGNSRLGEPQIRAIQAGAEVLKQSDVVPADTDVEHVLTDLIDPSFQGGK